ncbi:thioredoxin-disulfide reductase [Candidatus Dependentiae bacterium]|nr:thioredoxin-disulfide reductase [Candidatus Dependentiae bacterium]
MKTVIQIAKLVLGSALFLLGAFFILVHVGRGCSFGGIEKSKGSVPSQPTALSQPQLFDSKKALQSKNIVPLVVIGSGPAGLSAALYGARSSLYTLVFEGRTPGGQLTETTYVENWPGTPKLLGAELINITRKQAERFGAIVIADSIANVDFSQWPFLLKTEEGHELHALSVVIATGAKPRLLNDTRKTPGEKEYWAHGVTTCAVCDAPFYKGKKVVVVGGGDSAVEEATYLTAYAESVIMLVRGPALRAAPAMQARLKEFPKIKVLYNTYIEEIVGDKTLSVTAVKIHNVQEKKSQVLPVAGVFLAIGHHPNSDIFKKWVTTDKEGYITLTSRNQHTNVPGVFAAGDVSDKVYKQAGVASGDGIKAALDAYEFLQAHGYNESFVKQIEKNYFDPHPEADTYKLRKILSVKDFEKLAQEHPLLIVEVGAEHCASCKTLVKTMQSVASQLGEKASFATISLDDSSQELIKRFNLKSVPSLLIFKKEKLSSRYDQQLFSKRELYTMINQLLADA